MISNGEVAAALEGIASLLEILNENPFKVRSYRRAAEAVGGLSREVSALVEAGELQTIPGIGKSIAEVVGELVHNGDSRYLRELQARAPAGLLEMLRIPGFGPRKVSQVFSELGITSLDELEAAAREQRLRALPGFGAKTEQRVLQGLELVREGRGRWLLGDALPVAEGLRDRLAASPGVVSCELGGSARRHRETVGDLDLLATSDDPESVCGWFARLGGLASVEISGGTKVSGRTAAGLQVDLRVVRPESYGAALSYFTGSKEHNIRLRERAQKRGLTLSEYGVFRGEAQAKGDLVAGASEEEVYAALDLPWIPPELREDRGEIEAAAEGRLPELLAADQIRCDLHLHTTASDGHLSLEQMVEAARAVGYTHMGITEHSEALHIAHGLTRDRLLGQIEAIRSLNDRLDGFTVLAGTEADIRPDGSLDVPDDVWPDLDFVIGSVHQGFSDNAEKITARVVTAIASGRMDIFGHPTGRLILRRDPYAIDLEEVLCVARERDVAMEVNASPDRLDLGDAHCRLAVTRGVRIAINTDAHYREELANMRYGVMTARRGWVTAEDTINTWPLERLRQWLAGRRGR